MKNVFRKSITLLIIVASIGAFSFKLYTPSVINKLEEGHNTSALHELYLGQTSDMCRSGQLRITNDAGVDVLVPHNGTVVTVDVRVNSAKYWVWKCGSSIERSRISTCEGAVVTRLKVTHKDGRIIFRCYSHK